MILIIELYKLCPEITQSAYWPAHETNEYIDNGRFYKGCSYQNVQFLGQKKTVIRPTDPNLTIFIYNYQALLNKETFYGNFPKYELGQLTSTPGKIILNPFQIILTFKPIKNI